MKYAYINGKILDGTKDMQVKEGFVILTDNDKIEDIVKAGTDVNAIPIDKQKLDEIKKQKPEETKKVQDRNKERRWHETVTEAASDLADRGYAAF